MIKRQKRKRKKDKKYPESRGEIRSEKKRGSDGKVCKKNMQLSLSILVTVNSLVLCVMCIHQKLYAVSLLNKFLQSHYLCHTNRVCVVK